MNIVFMGSPDFAIPSLDAIYNSQHKVAAVVTPTDKIRARGHKVLYTPVKEYALEKNIPVLQPEKLKNNIELVKQLKSFNPDLFVVVAFKILPREIFSIPKYGSFNLHGSLLPKYRGAAPIQWSLIKGDTITGLTTFALADAVDTGNIYIQEKIDILPEDNFESLHDKMSVMGADLVLRTIDMIESGNFELKKQDDSGASPAPKITKEMCKIDFSKPAVEVKNWIRGLSPVPGASFVKDDKLIKVFKAEINSIKLEQGSIQVIDKKIYAGCSDTAIEILELQAEGRKRMTTEEFLRGNSL